MISNRIRVVGTGGARWALVPPSFWAKELKITPKFATFHDF